MVDYRLVNHKLLEVINALVEPRVVIVRSRRNFRVLINLAVTFAVASCVVCIAMFTTKQIEKPAKIIVEEVPNLPPKPCFPIVFVINVNHYHMPPILPQPPVAKEQIKQNHLIINFNYTAVDGSKISKEFFNVVR